MYHEYTQEELRSYCRISIESLETWARNLIHEKMVAEYSENYLNTKISNDEYLIKKDIRNHIKTMLEKEPERFKRPVDTLFIDHIVYFLCNPKWYDKLFKRALDYIYPQGKEEAREYLTRLIPIRNPLSHSNPISIRQVEQAICYSHDFIDGLKQYYKDVGEEKVWNVPRIIKIKDSFGNVFENPNDSHAITSVFNVKNSIYCGDTYSLEVEVDSSFEKEEYSVRWRFDAHDTSEFNDKVRFVVKFLPNDVAESTQISCTITSKKEWHKHKTYDNAVIVAFTVLPPLE